MTRFAAWRRLLDRGLRDPAVVDEAPSLDSVVTEPMDDSCENPAPVAGHVPAAPDPEADEARRSRFLSMYETHFGLTGAPFNLNPDPFFFYGSRGHSNALAYLKFGVYQGEGFVVVTGDIGAGKTTLVRTLLSELDAERIVAAQIVSTQLEAGDMLRSVALAFGIAARGLSKAELIATIEAFLTQLATESRRALLIVDEAQNLERGAVEELRMLSNFQLGSQALLQSFLVGQPELRALLNSRPMEQFRQRVIASCHLGPMDQPETRAYVEHRLRQVGWQQDPAFDDKAFQRIYQWTGGVPRRVNLICNRLLLAAYLSGGHEVDATLVDTVGEEVQRELGEVQLRTATPVPTPTPVPVPTSAATHRPSPYFAGPDAPIVEDRPTAERIAHEAAVGAPLLFVSTNEIDDLKLSVLLRAWGASRGACQGIRVRLGERSRFATNDAFVARLGVAVPVVDLEVVDAVPALRISEMMKRFVAVVDLHRPQGVVVCGSDDAALACALVAAKQGCGVVHVDAGRRDDGAGVVNERLVDRLADVSYVADAASYATMVREGAADDSVEQVPSLLMDVVPMALTLATDVPYLQSRLDRQRLELPAAGSYGLVRISQSIEQGTRASITALLSDIRRRGGDNRLVWPISRSDDAKLGALDLRRLADDERVSFVEPVSYPHLMALMKSAAFVLTDCADVQVEAELLEVRCLRVGAHRRSPAAAPARLDARTQQSVADRIAAHLAGWLRTQATR